MVPGARCLWSVGRQAHLEVVFAILVFRDSHGQSIRDDDETLLLFLSVFAGRSCPRRNGRLLRQAGRLGMCRGVRGPGSGRGVLGRHVDARCGWSLGSFSLVFGIKMGGKRMEKGE